VKEEPDTSLWGRAPLVTTRRGGYGLGLYHARQLFTLHGGDVEFRSNPEKSAVVSRITLPLAVEGAG
jgi:nitrogen-specific signal transduction histidine kinase